MAQRKMREINDRWAQIVLEEIIPKEDNFPTPDVRKVLSEIIGNDYATIQLTDWPERAKKHSYNLDKYVWGTPIYRYVSLRSLFRQYKERHNL